MTLFTRLSLMGMLLVSTESALAEQLNLEYTTRQKDEAVQLATDIYQVIEPYLLTMDIAACSVGLGCKTEPISEENRQKLIQRLASVIQDNRAIQLNLVAFPFKSGNRDHLVLGHLADMAEFKSLEYLDSLRAKIAEIYPPVNFTIYTDGLLFNDLFEIPDEHVHAYEDSLRQLGKSFPEIKIVTFSDMLSHKGLGIEEMRHDSDVSTKSHEPPADRVLLMEKRISKEINHSGHSFSKLSRLEKKARLKQLTQRIIGRVEAARTMIKESEPRGSFNLSAHLQKDFSKRLGLKLFPHGENLPSDSVLIENEDGTMALTPKMNVDLSKHRLVSQSINNVSCPYYCWR